MVQINSRFVSSDEAETTFKKLEIVPLSEQLESVENSQPLPELSVLKQLDQISPVAGKVAAKQMSSAAAPLSRNNHPAAAGEGGGSFLIGVLGVRSDAAAYYGGTFASEAAVEQALIWLTRHQSEDGGWRFDHTHREECDCDNTGTHPGSTGATGIALLAFYGAGYHHADGPHASTILRGLHFLLGKSNKQSETTYDLFDGDTGHGGIYQHGIATAALAEALAINRAILERVKRDPAELSSNGSTSIMQARELEELQAKLSAGCELAINYIVAHQHPRSGGWGYYFQQSGDTSILGWQLMALATARGEGIEIPRETWRNADGFLDSVLADFGYAYSPGKERKISTTAIGALCRFWASPGYKRSRLKHSIELVLEHGPSKGDMYYNYYATQALFAWGDEKSPDGEKLWTEWNDKTRDLLITLQSHDGHETGSWFFGSRREAGRHFDTCLAALTLEVYYRKLPAFQRLGVEALELK